MLEAVKSILCKHLGELWQNHRSPEQNAESFDFRAY
jgi:hypothetical protein